MDFILGAQYDMGSIPAFHTNRLWNPLDPQASAITGLIKKWTSFLL